MDAVVQENVFALGKWRVEPALNRMSSGEEIVRIEPQNMKLLLLLAARSGSVVSQSELEDEVWRGLVVTPNSVYQSVAQLRRALGDDKSHPQYIETVPRKGYRLIGQIRPEPFASTPNGVPQAGPQTSHTSEELGGQKSWLRRFRSSALAASAVTITVFVYFVAKENLFATAAVTTENAVHKTGDGYIDVLAARQGEPGTVSPSARAYLLTELSDQDINLGHLKQARTRLEEALALQNQASNNPDPRVARILVRLANLDLWERNYPSAEARGREAVRIFEAAAPALHPDKPRAYDVLTTILLDTEQYAEANTHAERSLQLATLLYGELHIRTIEAKETLAQLRLAEDRVDEAEAWARLAIDDHGRTYATEDLKSVSIRTTLMRVLLKKGRYADAAAIAIDSLKILERISLPTHPYVASVQQVLGESLTKMGKCDEAEKVLLAELHLLKVNEAAPWRIARAASALGEALLEQGRVKEAETHLMFASRELTGAKGSMENDARRATEKRIERLRQTKTAAVTSRSARS